jgi:hypothetical protein
VLHLARVFQVRIAMIDHCDLLEAAAALFQVEHFSRCRASVGTVARIHLNHDDAVWLPIRQRTPQHRAHQAEHRESGTNAKRQGRDHDGRKPRRPQQRAARISKVLKCGLDSLSEPYLADFFLDLLDTARFHQCLSSRFFAGHALGNLAIGQFSHIGA